MPEKISRLFSSNIVVILPIILVFIAIRFSYLDLPFYWDEAWSYAAAVFDMHDHGLAILPGDGNTELTRGHPLLFYFLAGVWTKLFGTGLIAVHLFPLLISCLLLVAVFMLADELFDRLTATGCAILFMLQSEFIAQSTLLLPEVMLALWTILTLYAYFRKKWVLYAIFSVFLVMTKESGILLIVMLLVDKILLENYFINEQKKGSFQKINELVILAVPLAVFATFMIMQKIRSGWFLFPDHVNMMVTDPHEILNRFRMILTKLFLKEGRNIFFFGILAGVIGLLIRKLLSRQAAHYLLLFLLFILFYIAFCSMNFFTIRYLLSVIPVFIIAGTWLITAGLKQKWLKISALCVFAILFAWHTFIDSKNEQDTSPGFKNSVILQKQAVNFAEEMNWQQKSIYSAFLMQYYMGIPNMGYLNDPENPFYQVKNKAEIDYDLYIFCSNERDPQYETFKESREIKLIKRFEKNKAWVEVYGKESH